MVPFIVQGVNTERKIIMIVGRQYHQVGGMVDVKNSSPKRQEQIRPGFPFNEKVGTYTGKTELGWLKFKLSGKREAIMNGGCYEIIEEKQEKNENSNK